MNPIGTMPVYLSMTSDLTKRQRRATAIKAVLTAAFALILFALLGKYLFDFFGISVAGSGYTFSTPSCWGYSSYFL